MQESCRLGPITLEFVTVKERTSRKCRPNEQDVFASSRDRNPQNFPATWIWRHIVAPNERRTPSVGSKAYPFAEDDHPVELFAF